MPAGFLVTRLLLACLLSEVEHNSIFATAQPPASQGVGNPYAYLPSLPLQYVQREGQLQNPHNPWAKLVEGFTKSRWPDQIRHPYQHLPQIRVKYPSDVVSRHYPVLDAKTIEFNVNVPVQHILKTLAFVNKGPEFFRDSREGDLSYRVSPVSYQEGAGGPSWPEQKGLPRDMAKRKRNPGLNFRFAAPVPGHGARRPDLVRPDLAYLLGQSGLAKQSSPEFGLERPIVHHGQGLEPCFGPAQTIPLGCPLVDQGQVNPSAQQQIQQPAQQERLQQQLPPILSQILTAGRSLSGRNIWTEEMAKRLPRFHLSIGNTPVLGAQQQQTKPVEDPETNKPQSTKVYPRTRCSPPEAQSSQGGLWILCPQLFRGWTR